MREEWRELSERLRASEPYRSLLAGARGASRLPAGALAWVGSLLSEDRDRPLLVLVPHEAEALAWLEMDRLLHTEPRAAYFPAPALTPYQERSTSLAVRAQEVLVATALARREVRIVVTTPRALFVRLPELDEILSRSTCLTVGDEIPPEQVAERLHDAGYQRVDLVSQAGDFSVRGGVLDLYPPGADDPCRLDYFGDSIESIRTFDPVTQRSQEGRSSLEIPPLALFPAGVAGMVAVADSVGERLADQLGPEALDRLRSLRQGIPFEGWESLLPLARETTRDLASLLPDAFGIALEPATLDEEARRWGRRLEEDYQRRRESLGIAVPPEELLVPLDRVLERLEGLDLRVGGAGDETDRVDFGARETEILHGQLPRLPREVESAVARGERFLLTVEEDHHEGLAELLRAREIALGRGGAEIVEGDLTRGFRLPAAGLTLFSEAQVFPRRRRGGARRRGPKYGPFVSGLRDLKVGDYVVHMDHGIGQFVGLRTVRSEDRDPGPVPATLRQGADGGPPEIEVMEIEYEKDRTLLLPLSRVHQIQKYSGLEGVAPKLDQLGGASWNKTKARVRKSVRQLAIDLLQLYAERQMAKAPAMPGTSDLERQFGAAFAFDETEDQLDAIDAIAEDLARERPMDRLLCGDVGFGKTEVAMRAAFKAVDHGHQVAVLAPTTILADQHLETFRRRFAGFPVTIEMISRFRSAAEIRAIRERVAAGRVDILIGTHRLLSKDIRLPELALLIIDEEQRFGVAQKERLRDLKKDLHVLAMSATPVPRTLQLSLGGVRDLSVIETPPRDRMAVETAIVAFTPEVVREAIEYERERDGQIYYVYNRVEDIERMADWLRELVPDLEVTVGHGQLDEHELSERMHAFTAGKYDVLVATTIIENGIHIPRVNTMLVHRADRFGLAQLYQLRGRVGRSSQLGYCYLMVPADRVVSQDARKRLDALRDFSELGAGFRIAARDLEIRGAGNLLGAEQSGHIAALGIETYMKLLEDTLQELKGEKPADEGPSATLDLPVPMSIPADYVPDANVRMELYRRIAAGESDEAEMLEELRDRFGPPPPAVRQLLEVATVQRVAQRLRVQSVGFQKGRLVVRLRHDARVDPERVVELVANDPSARFSPDGVLTIEVPSELPVAEAARKTLERLAS